MIRLNPGSKFSQGLLFFSRLNVNLCTVGKGQGKTHCLFTIHTKQSLTNLDEGQNLLKHGFTYNCSKGLIVTLAE